MTKVQIQADDGCYVGQGDGFGDVGLHESAEHGYVYDSVAHAEQQAKAIDELKGNGFLGCYDIVDWAG